MSLGVYTLKFLRLSILLKLLLPMFETAPLILIPFPIFHEHQGRQGQGHKLRCRRGQPDAVYPQITGRISVVISMNTKEWEKVRIAKTMPLDNAVNILLAKI